jgi:hypothetical protein
MYIAPNGERRPDRGARVFLFPAQWNAPKLDPDQFLDSSNAQAIQAAQTAIATGGGVYAVVDAGGEFSIPQLPAGHSQSSPWLVVSRHQSDEGGPGLSADERAALAAVFDRPDRLVGRMKYHFELLEPAAGSTLPPRDVGFDR